MPGETIQTDFSDSQNNVALQREGNRLGLGSHVRLCACAPEAGNLQSRGDLMGTELSVEL
jgi:hypothetical protein